MTQASWRPPLDASHLPAGGQAVAETGAAQHGVADQVRAETDRDMRHEVEQKRQSTCIKRGSTCIAKGGI